MLDDEDRDVEPEQPEEPLPPCAVCGGRLIPTMYGYPSAEGMNQANRGEVVLMGCLVSYGSDHVRGVCNDCGAELRGEDFPLDELLARRRPDPES